MSHDNTSPHDTPADSTAPTHDNVTEESSPTPPSAPRRQPAKALGHGAVVTLAVTYKGARHTVKTYQDVMDKAQAIFNERSKVTFEEGRFGVKLNFAAFRTTKWSWAAPSPKHWGLQFDRWTSEKPNGYIVAAHMILAADYRDTAKDCKHPEHAKVGHVCHAMEVVHVGVPADLAASMKERRMARRQARKAKRAAADTADEAVEEANAVPTDASEVKIAPAEAGEPVVEPETGPEPAVALPPPAEPIQDAVAPVPLRGTSAVAQEVIRHLPSLRNLATPSVVHITADGDIFIATDLKGDDAYRMFELRSRHYQPRGQAAGAAPAADLSPKAYINVERLVPLFQKEGPDGITFTKACVRLGPWKDGEFDRKRPGLGAWQDAYHDCFRKNRLKDALRKVKLDLHKLTVDDQIQMDEHGDIVWTVVTL